MIKMIKYILSRLKDDCKTGLLNDEDIKREFGSGVMIPGAIAPFYPELVKKGLSFGLGSFGYDIRLSPYEFRVMEATGKLIDPKKQNKDDFHLQEVTIDSTGAYFILPGNTFALGFAMEYIAMPPDVLAICNGKSTNARAGLIVNITPVEPGWRGYLTIEIINPSPNPCKVYAAEGIAQLLFFKGKEPTTKYESRKYQDQPEEVVTAKVV